MIKLNFFLTHYFSFAVAPSFNHVYALPKNHLISRHFVRAQRYFMYLFLQNFFFIVQECPTGHKKYHIWWKSIINITMVVCAVAYHHHLQWTVDCSNIRPTATRFVAWNNNYESSQPTNQPIVREIANYPTKVKILVRFVRYGGARSLNAFSHARIPCSGRQSQKVACKGAKSWW